MATEDNQTQTAELSGLEQITALLESGDIREIREARGILVEELAVTPGTRLSTLEDSELEHAKFQIKGPADEHYIIFFEGIIPQIFGISDKETRARFIHYAKEIARTMGPVQDSSVELEFASAAYRRADIYHSADFSLRQRIEAVFEVAGEKISDLQLRDELASQVYGIGESIFSLYDDKEQRYERLKEDIAFARTLGVKPERLHRLDIHLLETLYDEATSEITMQGDYDSARKLVNCARELALSRADTQPFEASLVKECYDDADCFEPSTEEAQPNPLIRLGKELAVENKLADYVLKFEALRTD